MARISAICPNSCDNCVIFQYEYKMDPDVESVVTFPGRKIYKTMALAIVRIKQ